MTVAQSPHPPLRHSGRGHLKALDGIRGLAILMVASSHAFLSNVLSGNLVQRLAGEALLHGNVGVDLFFVLSGFLITGILVDTINDSGYFRKFYARRILRIFPIYYAVLFTFLLLTPVLHLNWGGMAIPLLLFAQNLRPDSIHNFHLGPVELAHFWSLAVEEQFYLVWPAAILFLRTPSRILRAAAIVSALALISRVTILLLKNPADSFYFIHVGTFFRADSLLCGAALAVLYRSRHWLATVRWAPPVFLVTIVIIHIGFWLEPRTHNHLLINLWDFGFRYTFLILNFGALIVWALKEGSLVHWIFQMRWLRFFGKYSYGLYVYHLLILPAVISRLRPWFAAEFHSKFLGVLLSALVGLAACTLAAFLSYQLFEKHFLRLKKYFDYDRPTEPTIAPPLVQSPDLR